MWGCFWPRKDITFGITKQAKLLGSSQNTGMLKCKFTPVLILLVSVPPGITPHSVLTSLQQLSGTKVWFPSVKGVLRQSV